MQGSIDATSLKRCEARVRVLLRHMSACFRRPSLAAAGAIAGLFFAGACFDGASAQPRTNSEDGPELRTLYANSQDIAEGKRIAESSCAGCHGANGISTSPGVPTSCRSAPGLPLPRAEGLPSRRPRRKRNEQRRQFLSDDALVKVAAYFASLDPPQTSAAQAMQALPHPIRFKPASRGGGCAGCHGEGGISKTPGMPSLVGLDPKYLVAAMKAYKSGQRKNDMMKAMLACVTDASINNIALFYALQKPARAKTPAAGDQAAGKDGGSCLRGMPRRRRRERNSGDAEPGRTGCDISRERAAGLQEGTRSDETMKGLAASLDDSALKNLAAFYAAQEPKPPNVRKPLTPRNGRSDAIVVMASTATAPIRACRPWRDSALDYLEKVLAGLSDGRAQEPTDGRNVRRADRAGYREPCGPLCAPEGARGGICDIAVQTGHQMSRTTSLGALARFFMLRRPSPSHLWPARIKGIDHV